MSWDQGGLRNLGHGKAVPAQASRIHVEKHFRARAGAVTSSWEMSSRCAPCQRVSRQEVVCFFPIQRCRWIRRDHAGEGTCPGFVWSTMHGGNSPFPRWGSSGRQHHPRLAMSLCGAGRRPPRTAPGPPLVVPLHFFHEGGRSTLERGRKIMGEDGALQADAKNVQRPKKTVFSL